MHYRVVLWISFWLVAQFAGASTGGVYSSFQLDERVGLASDKVYAVHVDHNGHMWMGTPKGASVWNHREVINYAAEDGLAGLEVWDVQEDEANRIWLGHHGAGITLFQNGIFRKLPGNYNPEIRVLFHHRDTMYIGTEEGLYAYDAQSDSVALRFHREGAKKAQITSIFVHQNRVHFTTYRGGLFRLGAKGAENLNFTEGDMFISGCSMGDSVMLSIGYRYHRIIGPDGDYYDRMVDGVVLWDYQNTPIGKLAASWGVSMVVGGIFRWSEKDRAFVDYSSELGINSLAVPDISYDSITERLYVATHEGGVRVVDLSGAVKKQSLEIPEGEELLSTVPHGPEYLLLTDKNLYRADENLGNLIRIPIHDKVLGMVHRCRVDTLTLRAFQSPELKSIAPFENHQYLLHAQGYAVLLNPALEIERVFHHHSEKIIRYGSDYFALRDYGTPLQYLPTNDSIVISFSHSIREMGVFLGTYEWGANRYIATNDVGLYHWTLDTLYPVFRWPEEMLRSGFRPVEMARLNADIIIVLDNTDQLHRLIFENGDFELTTMGGMTSMHGGNIRILETENGVLVVNREGLALIGPDGELNHVPFGVHNSFEYETVSRANGHLYLMKGQELVQIETDRFFGLYKDQVEPEFIWKNEMEGGVGDRFEYQNAGAELAVNIRYGGRPIAWNYRVELYRNEVLWESQEMKDRTVNFSRFSPGKYRLVWVAEDALGVERKRVEAVNFRVEPPYWQKTWFVVLAVLLGTALVVVISLWLSSRYFKRKQREVELENRLSTVRLEALQSQMSPHFIFNALNSIQSLILSSQMEDALYYLNRFARLTRYALESASEKEVDLEIELEFLRTYVELENLRWRDEIKVRFEVADALYRQKVKIPPLIVQPLIENAYKHAFDGSQKDKQLDIRFTRTESGIQIDITDNGKGIDMSRVSGSKGINIIRERLSLAYSGKALLSIQNNDPSRGTKVQVVLPVSLVRDL